MADTGSVERPPKGGLVERMAELDSALQALSDEVRVVSRGVVHCHERYVELLQYVEARLLCHRTEYHHAAAINLEESVEGEG